MISIIQDERIRFYIFIFGYFFISLIIIVFSDIN